MRGRRRCPGHRPAPRHRRREPPDSRPYRVGSTRAKTHLLNGEFAAAADDYAQVIQLQPEAIDFWYFRMCLLAFLATDKAHEAVYHDACARCCCGSVRVPTSRH